MKRTLSRLLLVTVLVLGLSLNAFANNGSFTVSEDYKTVILDGVTYIQTQTSCMSFWELMLYERKPTLTEKQSQELLDVGLFMDPEKDILEASFYFQSGATLTASYIREDYLDEFLHWTTGDDVQYSIDFYWPNGNTVVSTTAQLKGTPLVLSSTSWSWGETYEVSLEIENGTRYIQRGMLVVDKDQYYYIDYPENRQLALEGYFSLSGVSSVDAYEITDPQLLAQLRQAKEDSLVGTQILSSSTFGNTLSAIMMSLLFGFVPVVMLVLTGILAIRSKGSYRVIWGTTAGLAIVTLLIYVGFVIQLMLR